MAAATGIVVNDRPGGFTFTGSFTLAAGSLLADTREVETVAIMGARIGDIFIVSSRTQMLAGLDIVEPRVVANDQCEFGIQNTSAGALQQPSGTFDWALIRGTTGPLR